MPRREHRSSSPTSRFPRRCVAVIAGLAAVATLPAAEISSAPRLRLAPLPAPPDHAPGFSALPAASLGLAFTNTLSAAAGAANRVLENGSGVALGDFDGDDWTDVFLCGIAGPSRLFRNLGNWHFAEVTASAGLEALAGEACRGAVFADLDGDRRLDLLVSTLAHGVKGFLNSGDGRFRESTAALGLAEPRPGATTLALADVDGDGSLDLYVTRYRAEDIRDSANVEARVVNGRTELHPKYHGRLFVSPLGLMEFGEADSLYLNDGHGHFREVSWTGGAFLDEAGAPLPAPPRDWGLSATFRDLNDDGRPDLYVCNDYWTSDRLWINQGGGVFRAAPREALRHTPENSMGVDVADVDQDGHPDLFVVDMLARDPRVRRRQAVAQTPIPARSGDWFNRPQSMQNMLFLGRGDGTFAEAARYAGLEASDWSWQPLFLDVDLDGLDDLLIPTGHRRDLQDLDATDRVRALQHPWPANVDAATRQRTFVRELQEHAQLYPPLPGPVVAFRNAGQRRFAERTLEWGFTGLAVHQGAATADLDGDGDLDLVVNVLDGPPQVYRNEGSAPRLTVYLRGRSPNTAGIGAQVSLTSPVLPRQSREIFSGGRYLSGGVPMAVFAIGATNPAPELTLEVRWRSGVTTRIAKVLPQHSYWIDEPEAPVPSLSPPPPPSAPSALFELATNALTHLHHEPRAGIPLGTGPVVAARPRTGPALAWWDLNHDGWEDLLVAEGAEGRLALYTNNAHGRLEAAASSTLAPAGSNHLAVLAYEVAGQSRLLLSANPGLGGEGTPPLQEWSWPDATASVRLDATPASLPGTLALGDLDGDGTLELFQGGRALPEQYPRASPSRIFRRVDGRWQVDAAASRGLAELGVVRSAVWGDLDDDGAPDLLVASDWSPLRVFRNQRGQLVEQTQAWGLSSQAGWWSGVALGDFDGDGHLDIVAGNWGLNSSYAASAEFPLRLAYGDFLGRDVVDTLETFWDHRRRVLYPRPSWVELATPLPPVRAWFTSHAQFAETPLEGLVAHFAKPPAFREVQTLASTLFRRRRDRFVAEPLPEPAQLSPVFGVAVADFDGDGHEDLVLAQNTFDVPATMPRQDAGLGLLLLGQGDGNWIVPNAESSGLRLWGEQRAVAIADYDRDGRADVVFGQNAGPAALFHNRGGEPGVRVRLAGPPGNAAGFGVILRAGNATGLGPARLITGGTGFGSANSPTTVLTRPGGITRLWIRWPFSEPQEVVVPANATEVRLDRSGTVTVVRSR